jgi:hypothetical protein
MAKQGGGFLLKCQNMTRMRTTFPWRVKVSVAVLSKIYEYIYIYPLCTHTSVNKRIGAECSRSRVEFESSINHAGIYFKNHPLFIGRHHGIILNFDPILVTDILEKIVLIYPQ